MENMEEDDAEKKGVNDKIKDKLQTWKAFQYLEDDPMKAYI